jgi:hypothetical protein
MAGVKPEDGNGWPEMKRLIEYRLDSVDRQLVVASDERAEMRSEIASIRSEFAVMKSKGGIWGAISGFLAGIGAYLGGRIMG